MKLAYHPLVQPDVSGILQYYDRISPSLGDEFWTELQRVLEVLSAQPEQCHFSARGLRRANMRRFPYHVLFRMSAGAVRVVVIRHDKRNPSYGTTRK